MSESLHRYSGPPCVTQLLIVLEDIWIDPFIDNANSLCSDVSLSMHVNAYIEHIPSKWTAG